jgi:hypothetical protein
MGSGGLETQQHVAGECIFGVWYAVAPVVGSCVLIDKFIRVYDVDGLNAVL